MYCKCRSAARPQMSATRRFTCTSVSSSFAKTQHANVAILVSGMATSSRRHKVFTLLHTDRIRHSCFATHVQENKVKHLLQHSGHPRARYHGNSHEDSSRSGSHCLHHTKLFRQNCDVSHASVAARQLLFYNGVTCQTQVWLQGSCVSTKL